jgi:3-hydroxybutyryl-CoA dehydrogenase
MSIAQMTVGVVGGGTMGRGIVQLFAQSGFAMRCFDAQPGAAAKAMDHALGMIARAVEKGRMSAGEFEAVQSRVSVASDLAGLAGCGLVVEAVVEDLAVKRDLFARLEPIVGDDAILATNTSSLTVAEIAAGCARPQRVAGLHFFNPVPLMKVAEVIAAVRTAPSVIATLKEATEKTGHRAVVVVDQPGVLINHAGRGLYTEGMRIVEEQVASPADVDDVLRDAMGFRMGPFELLDLTGLDVSSKVMTSIYEQFQHEPRFRPSSLVAPRVSAGLFGRKSGEGWYRYDEQGRKVAQPARSAPKQAPARRVLLGPGVPDAWRERVRGAGWAFVQEPEHAEIAILAPWGSDATSAALALGVDPRIAVAVDPMTPFELRRTLMITSVTTPDVRDAVHAVLASDGTPVTVINDSCGFIAQRVMATIVNIAANIAQRGIAAVSDLEDAVQLGLGYPHGPLAWGDRIGARNVMAILQGQLAQTGDPRYRPSPWLVRRAMLGVPLTTPESAR